MYFEQDRSLWSQKQRDGVNIKWKSKKPGKVFWTRLKSHSYFPRHLHVKLGIHFCKDRVSNLKWQISIEQMTLPSLKSAHKHFYVYFELMFGICVCIWPFVFLSAKEVKEGVRIGEEGNEALWVSKKWMKSKKTQGRWEGGLHWDWEGMGSFILEGGKQSDDAEKKGNPMRDILFQRLDEMGE